MLHQRDQRRDIQCSRHHKNTQIFAKRAGRFQTQGQTQICIQRPLVKLIKNYGTDAG